MPSVKTFPYKSSIFLPWEINIIIKMLHVTVFFCVLFAAFFFKPKNRIVHFFPLKPTSLDEDIIPS